MIPKKNDEFEVLIEDLTKQGEGIGHVEGYTLFIKDAIPGDTVLAHVTKVKKNYGYARPMKIIKHSPNRVEPPCPVAKRCGGCQLMSMTYESQLAFKEKLVRDNLERIGGFSGIEIEPIVGADDYLRYRNKAQFPVSEKDGRLIAGYYAAHSHDVIENEDCMLSPESHTRILKEILKAALENKISAYDEESGKGVLRHVLIRQNAKGLMHVCLVINADELPKKREISEFIMSLPEVTGVSLNINKKKSNVILGKETRCIGGSEYLEDELCGIKFRISPASFYQVNHAQTEKLYGLVKEFANLCGNETVYDLYCGAGTIGLTLAKQAGSIIGIEIVRDAVENARENAKRNGIKNAEYIEGAAEEILGGGFDKGDFKRPDVVIVDPPRKGCDEKLLNSILSARPKKIVYVSCDPATLARDLKILCREDYEIKRIRPVDCFCETVHVETVVLMSRKDT